MARLRRPHRHRLAARTLSDQGQVLPRRPEGGPDAAPHPRGPPRKTPQQVALPQASLHQDLPLGHEDGAHRPAARPLHVHLRHHGDAVFRPHGHPGRTVHGLRHFLRILRHVLLRIDGRGLGGYHVLLDGRVAPRRLPLLHGAHRHRHVRPRQSHSRRRPGRLHARHRGLEEEGGGEEAAGGMGQARPPDGLRQDAVVHRKGAQPGHADHHLGGLAPRGQEVRRGPLHEAGPAPGPQGGAAQDAQQLPDDPLLRGRLQGPRRGQDRAGGARPVAAL
mmetsp:Transcript_51461/g.117079  ORF Transcript_51461/g.117079 Transcript_51461/m.117079 type:complete len:276 (+) Transcript_51461:487-1314(+)